jgi:hypothetical protein
MKNLAIGLGILIIAAMLAAGCTESKKGTDSPETPLPSPTTQLENKSQSQAESLDASATALAEKVFPEFQQVKMDPLDAFPVFQTTKAQSFHRLQRKAPITVKVGRAYPRIILKAYQFVSEEDASKEVTVWLNGLPSSAEKIELGQEVKSVKSPPLYCALIGKTFYIVQAACLYDGPEWQENRKLFFAEMAEQKADYAWEINCNKGELTYQIKPED